MSTSTGNIPLVSGALVAATLIAESLALLFLSFAFAVGSGQNLAEGVGTDASVFFGALAGSWFRYVQFGLGVFIALKFIAPIGAGDGWRRVILRGLVAAAIGAAVLFVVGALEGFVGSASLGDHPFGYSLDPSLSTDNLGSGIVGALFSAANGFVTWLPLAILAGVLQRLWLRHRAATAAADPVSGAATP